ncbi:MAG: YfhO family protein [Clostridiales bacterium]|nr:YfhO family protein [Clostridiales bacterium]
MIEKTTISTPKKNGKRLFSRQKSDFRPVISFFVSMALLILVFFFTGISPFGDRSILCYDLAAQYAPFLVTMRNMLSRGEPLLYSFQIGMGKNMTGILAYYLSSPLNLLTLLFPASHISDAIVVMILLKLSLAGAFMTWLMDRIFPSESRMSIVFAQMYCLSSFAMVFLFNFMWLDGFAILPLLLLVTDSFRKDPRQWWKLCPVMAVLFLSGYYMAYIVGVFSFFTLITVLVYDRKKSEDKYASAKTVGLFIVAALCAALISACILVPAGLDTIRNGDNSSTLGISLDTSFRLVDLIPQLFGADVVTVSGNLPYIFCGTSTLLLVILFYLNPDIPKRLKTVISCAFVFFILSFLLPPLNLAWHFFNMPNWFLYRFSFLLSFLMILVAYYSYLNAKTLRGRNYLAAFGVVFVLLVLAERFSEKIPVGSIFFPVLITAVCTLFFLKTQNIEKWPESVASLQKYGTAMFALVMLFEMVIVSPKHTIGITLSGTQKAAEFASEVDDLRALTKGIPSEQGQRTEILSALGKNIDGFSSPSYGDFTSTGTFCSMANKEMHHFLKQLGYKESFNYCGSEHICGILPSDALMGVRYYIGLSEKDSGLPLVSGNSRYSLYENPYALPIAFLTDESVFSFDGYTLEKDENDKDYFAYQERFFTTLSGEDASALYETFIPEWEVFNGQETPARVEGTFPAGNKSVDRLNHENPASRSKNLHYYIRNNQRDAICFSTVIDVEEDAPLYMVVPFLMRACPIQVYVNGERIYKENSDSFYSTILNLGHYTSGDKVEVQIRSNTDVFVSFRPIMAYCHVGELQKQTDILRHGISNVSVKDGHVSFRADAESESLLLTTIPFEKGWTAYIDGQEADIRSFQDAFICVTVPKGTHEVDLRFTPPGLGLGVIMSGVGFVSYLVLAAVTLRKKRMEE